MPYRKFMRAVAPAVIVMALAQAAVAHPGHGPLIAGGHSHLADYSIAALAVIVAALCIGRSIGARR